MKYQTVTGDFPTDDRRRRTQSRTADEGVGALVGGELNSGLVSDGCYIKALDWASWQKLTTSAQARPRSRTTRVLAAHRNAAAARRGLVIDPSLTPSRDGSPGQVAVIQAEDALGRFDLTICGEDNSFLDVQDGAWELVFRCAIAGACVHIDIGGE